jgi:hypothetical protein
MQKEIVEKETCLYRVKLLILVHPEMLIIMHVVKEFPAS